MVPKLYQALMDEMTDSGIVIEDGKAYRYTVSFRRVGDRMEFYKEGVFETKTDATPGEP